MPKATTTPKAKRRKVSCRALVCNVPGPEGSSRFDALMRLSMTELKNLLRAAGIGIPKDKRQMATRLAGCDDVVVTVTTEAAVLK